MALRRICGRLVEKFLQLRGEGQGEWGYCFLDGRKLRLGGCIVGDVVGKYVLEHKFFVGVKC